MRRHLLSRLLRRTSLRTILIVPFVLQLAGAVGLVGYLSYRNSQRAVYDLASQLRYEITARIQQQLQSYVDIPHSINRINGSALLSGDINIQGASGFNQLWEQAKLFPNTNLIYCASEQDGSLLGVGRREGDRALQLVAYNASTGRLGHYYDLDTAGDVVRLRHQGSNIYDARKRPWYREAKAKGQSTWSEIYLDFDTELPTITASTPVFDRSGRRLLGVCATDFILPAEMSSFLRSLAVGKSGETFIVKRSGVLVATSTTETLIDGDGDRVQYRLATESTDPLIRGTALHLQDQFADLTVFTQPQQLAFDLDGAQQLVQVLPFQDGRGIDWLIVVVIPEADFMGDIQRNTHLTLALYLLSLSLAIAIGIMTARWVTRPILNLNAAAKNLAQGEWDQDIQMQRSDEVGELAQSFNQMAAQLKESFKILEARNTDLQIAKDELGKANEQLEAVLNAVPGPISWIASDGFYLGINSYLADSLHLPPESIVGSPIGIVGDSPQYVAFINQFLSSSSSSASQEIPIHVNGADRYYLLAAQKYQQGTAIVVVGIDITERRLAQDELRKAQQTNQAIVSAIPDLLMRIRSDGTCQGFNFGRMKALNEGSFHVGVSIYDLSPFDQAEKRMQYVRQALDTRELQIYEYGIEIDGESRYEEARVMPLNEDEVLVMVRDMTQRQQSEAALRRSEANIRALIAAMPDLLIRVRRDGTYHDIQGRNRLALYHGDEFQEGTSVYDSLPPLEAQRRMHYIQRTLQTGAMQVYEQQLTIDGHLQYEEVRMVVTGNDEVLMIIRNITEQKRAEAALRIAEENYRGIFENALEGIFQSTPKGVFIRVNPAMARIYGYDSPEHMLLSITDIEQQIYVDPAARHEFQRQMVETGEIKNQVYQSYRRDGSIIWVEENARAVRDDDDNLLYYEGIIEDITDQKRQKEILEERVNERTQELSEALQLLKATQAELMIENALLRSDDQVVTFDYQVGGSLPLDAPTYVVRQADRYLYAGLRRGEFCYVFNSRQMGKSSLRVQIMRRLQSEGFACAAIDISEIGNRQLTAEQWYAGFVYMLANAFNLLDQVDIRSWWRDRQFLSPVQRLGEFFHEIVLTQISQKIVIFIDEIDSVINLDFEIDDFFVLLRACYNKRADQAEYQRLTFALFGVATPSQLIRDKTRTPFNIGQAIQLKDFQLHEAQPLLQGLTEKVENPPVVLREILSWTNGQPFLTQKICKLIRNAPSPIPTNHEATWIQHLVSSQIIENWEFNDEPEHLRTIRDRILKDEAQAIALLRLYETIWHQANVSVMDDPIQSELLLSGLVIKQQDTLKVHNRVYQIIFDAAWINRTLGAIASRL